MAISKLVYARWVLGFACLAFAPGLVHAESSKSAVSPQASEEPEQPAVAVIFTGFARRADKGASVFVRMTGEVPVAAERSGKRLTYRLEGAKLGVANNGNPLPTEHFGPPVSHIALVPVQQGVDLVIDLNAESAQVPPHRLVSQGGLSTLHVDLPPPGS